MTKAELDEAMRLYWRAVIAEANHIPRSDPASAVACAQANYKHGLRGIK